MSTPTYYLRRYCLPVCALTLAACHKLVTAPPPQDEMSIAAVFSNDDDAAAAMQGYYNIAMNNQRGPVNGAIGLDAALSADELICTTPPAADDSFQVYNLSATTPQNTESFDILYKLILQINTMLLGLRSSSGMSAPAKAQMEGEALFNRAFVYFYLANLYGSVPLVLTTDYLTNSALPGAPTDSIYAQMTADLEQAIQLLPASYTEGTGVNIGHRVHPDRSAAQALLARVLLYRKQWAAAETSATIVIEDPGYTLEPNPDSVFLSTSREAIWQLRPFYGATAEAIAYGKRPSFALTPQLAGSLETGDLRARWIDSTLYQGHVILYPYKYRLITDTGAVMEYETVLRLSEHLPCLAEGHAVRRSQGAVGGARRRYCRCERHPRQGRSFTHPGHNARRDPKRHISRTPDRILLRMGSSLAGPQTDRPGRYNPLYKKRMGPARPAVSHPGNRIAGRSQPAAKSRILVNADQ